MNLIVCRITPEGWNIKSHNHLVGEVLNFDHKMGEVTLLEAQRLENCLEWCIREFSKNFSTKEHGATIHLSVTLASYLSGKSKPKAKACIDLVGKIQTLLSQFKNFSMMVPKL